MLPIGLAWEAYGEGNGAGSFADFVDKIGGYRDGTDRDYAFRIGCILLADPFWLDEADWIPVPPDWAPNIVSFNGWPAFSLLT